MDDNVSPAESAGLSVDLIHSALEHLYSNVELADCGLAALFPETSTAVDAVKRAQALRNLLLGAIESLRPPRLAPPHMSEARGYHVLMLRYVSGMQVEQIAERLALGVRQVYRELHRAEVDLSRMLTASTLRGAHEAGSAHTPDTEGAHSVPAVGDDLASELSALAAATREVDLASALRRAISTVGSLATARHVRIAYHGPRSGIEVDTTPGVLGQVLVQALSASIQGVDNTLLPITLEERDGYAVVVIELPARAGLPHADLLAPTLELAAGLGISSEVSREGQVPCQVQLRLHLVKPQSVLIVEDNPAVCELYRRYLQGSNWHPTIESDPRQAAAAAAGLRPAAIVVDILMPELEGWSVLQALQVDPQTEHIPVIICSVVHDPALAQALGAAASLKKPVSRQELLAVLERVTLPHSAA